MFSVESSMASTPPQVTMRPGVSLGASRPARLPFCGLESGGLHQQCLRSAFVANNTKEQIPWQSRSVVCHATLRRRKVTQDDDDDGRRRAVMQYVRDVQPSEVQAFIEESSPTVVAAFKQTVSNMVGTLPSQYFSVTIDTVADSLATLMQTMLRTGYLLRSAQYQLDLELALHGPTPTSTAAAAGKTIGAPFVKDSSTDAQDSIMSASSYASEAGSFFDRFASASQTQAASGVIEPEIVSSSSSSGSDEEPAMQANMGSGATASQAATATASVGNTSWSHNDGDYAPGVQTSKVSGEVMRWHNSHGIERMDARDYIAMLEEKVRALEVQLHQKQQQQGFLAASGAGFGSSVSAPVPIPSHNTSATVFANPNNTNFGNVTDMISHPNPAVGAATAAAAAAAAAAATYTLSGSALPAATDLLSYLRSLDSAALTALGSCGQDVTDAMSMFVGRLMGTSDKQQLQSMTSEFSAVELSKLLFWLLVVGWSLRALEVRWDMEQGGGGSAVGGGVGGGPRLGLDGPVPTAGPRGVSSARSSSSYSAGSGNGDDYWGSNKNWLLPGL